MKNLLFEADPYINSEFDPWRETSVSADLIRPGGPMASTVEAPVLLIPGGVHCADMFPTDGEYNTGLQAVIDQAVAQMKTWVTEYYI